MKKNLTRYFPAIVLAFGFAQAQEDIEFKRVSISGQFDNGQVIRGKTDHFDLAADVKLEGSFFTRTGVWITQEAVVKQRLTLKMGVGGIFWYALPTDEDNISTRQTQFGPGISQAQGVYTFGDLENPSAHLQMGYFPYKYNPDAKNLGEYLLRSGTYPGYLVTGGWNQLNSAGYMVQGLRLNVPWWNGKAQTDVVLAMEHDLPPLFSLSPALLTTLSPVKGVKIGAGAACHHCISPKPSQESPKVPDNQIILSGSYDSATSVYTYVRDTNSYYTFQGIKLMGSLSFDPKAYVPMAFLGPEDLKVYGEIALLGWKNYSYLYEKRTERMPVMAGINLPTFKLLDVLSLEVEYLNSPFTNNYRNLIYGSTPTWVIPGGDGANVEQEWVDDYEANTRRDNWKWSLYGKKEVTRGINIYAQAASDHLRTITANFGPYPTFVPITNRNGKDWYYLVRVEFGI